MKSGHAVFTVSQYRMIHMSSRAEVSVQAIENPPPPPLFHGTLRCASHSTAYICHGHGSNCTVAVTELIDLHCKDRRKPILFKGAHYPVVRVQ